DQAAGIALQRQSHVRFKSDRRRNDQLRPELHVPVSLEDPPQHAEAAPRLLECWGSEHSRLSGCGVRLWIECERFYRVAENVAHTAVGHGNLQPKIAARPAPDKKRVPAFGHVDHPMRHARAHSQLRFRDDHSGKRLRLFNGKRAAAGYGPDRTEANRAIALHRLENWFAHSRISSASGSSFEKIARGCALWPAGLKSNAANSGSRVMRACVSW